MSARYSVLATPGERVELERQIAAAPPRPFDPAEMLDSLVAGVVLARRVVRAIRETPDSEGDLMIGAAQLLVALQSGKLGTTAAAYAAELERHLRGEQ